MILQVPLHKEPRWLWDTMGKWLQTSDNIIKRNKIPACAKSLLKIVDLHKEAEWLKTKIREQNYKVVFCHNDMQEGNILMCLDNENNNLGPKLVVIGKQYN